MKNILFLFALLLSASGARGQIYVDSYRFGGPVDCGGLILDSDCAPDAEFAVSLRKLRTAYTGNCVEVRNATTGRTFTVGFSGNFLDTVRLKDSCATANCFVRTWYDQSGLGRDAIQTTGNRQPQITSSGALLKTGNNVEMRFDNTSGSEDGFTAGTAGNFNFLHNGTPSTFLVVAKPWNTNSPGNVFLVPFSTSTNTATVISGIGYQIQLDNRTNLNYTKLVRSLASNGSGVVHPFINKADDNSIILNSASLFIDFIDADNATAANRSELHTNNNAVYKNNTSTAAISSSNSAAFSIGWNGNTPGHEGGMYEIILTDIDYKSKVESLKTNINNFYNIW